MFRFFAAGLCKFLPVMWEDIGAENWVYWYTEGLVDEACAGCWYLWVQIYVVKLSWSVAIEEKSLFVWVKHYNVVRINKVPCHGWPVVWFNFFCDRGKLVCAVRELYLQELSTKQETIFFAFFSNQTLWGETKVREKVLSSIKILLRICNVILFLGWSWLLLYFWRRRRGCRRNGLVCVGLMWHGIWVLLGCGGA